MREVDQVERLRALMAKHKLSRADVARLSGRSAKTVESWFASPAAGNFRRLHPSSVDLVELRLDAEKEAARKKARRRAPAKKAR